MTIKEFALSSIIWVGIIVFIIFYFFDIDFLATKKTDRFENVATIKLIGKCSDLEDPSKLKKADTYDVEGNFKIIRWPHQDIGYTSYGDIRTTIQEYRNRFSKAESLNLDYFDPVWDAIIDTPDIKIFDIPTEIIQSDTWNLSVIHNYSNREDFLDSIYGDRKAKCVLNVEQREGEIPDILLNEDRLCFILSCKTTYKPVEKRYSN